MGCVDDAASNQKPNTNAWYEEYPNFCDTPTTFHTRNLYTSIAYQQEPVYLPFAEAYSILFLVVLASGAL